MRVARATVAVASAAALALTAAACGGTGTATSDGKSVTVYSADGLGSWYKTQFAKFEARTGIAVNLVEAGSGEVVNRVDKEQSNPQADIVVTLPPFIQKADRSGLLRDSGVDTAAIAETDKDPGGKYVTLAGNHLCFIANPAVDSTKSTWDDLLKPELKGKIQYSTPGQAGDGTAVLILLQQLYGKQGALDYLTKLQANNVGPSSSTGKLQPKVDNGELLVANGDIQMNLASIKDKGSKFQLFFPATADGKRSTVAVPYVMGLAKGAPHRDSAKRLMEFLLSAEVQQTLGPDAMAVPVRTDLKDAAAPAGTMSPAAYLAGVNVVHPDWNRVLDELDGDIAAYQKATGS
ncbi:2-aminoethylphosphonate ABC transporter substrate-binding protein [Nocardia sp. CDC159]|uniref:2-aminoethylphosphonate ABC transporter substrate-binding protein n=1 Tax=Nocardia pulmonis TaxID=2951408 RepID=A0A9X2IXL5_9NOCA|nr:MULTISPECIES: 2-aminoethylphosphonate ABC transporter substrate-binding protein [Nocardia]MCM6773995.1 2-aminoethylphosphonate ABC transporter substrate-binding protein [Nocardia pulmonis]MCM6786882.1 2-aminoethylphosphonate ABC transporter substrate-binding protein [Nocardia sp. CDC159]